MRKLIYGMNMTLDGYIAAPGDDILGALIRSGRESPCGGFTPRELLDQICMLFLAGHETSASAIGVRRCSGVRGPSTRLW